MIIDTGLGKPVLRCFMVPVSARGAPMFRLLLPKLAKTVRLGSAGTGVVPLCSDCFCFVFFAGTTVPGYELAGVVEREADLAEHMWLSSSIGR